MMGNEVAKIEKNITDTVMNRVNAMQEGNEIHFPPNYSYQNALKSAWLNLQTVKMRDKTSLAIEKCDKNSIANALLDMVVQGLNPAKKQCYFVPYGNSLTLMRSYFGSIAAAKQLSGVKNVVANCIYEGDIFEYHTDLETGNRVIDKHEQKLDNIDFDKMQGAYAIVVTAEDQPNHIEIMSIAQIKQSWNMGMGEGKVHKQFKDQMAMKTVIQRACKYFVNTSDDSHSLAESFNRTTENEYLEKEHDDYEVVQEEIEQNANVEKISFVPDEPEPSDDLSPEEKAEIEAAEQQTSLIDEEDPYK